MKELVINIKINDLETIARLLLQDYAVSYGKIITIYEDWHKDLFDPFEVVEQKEMGIGSLVDATESIQGIISGEYCTSTNDVVWTADVLMYLADTYNHNTAPEGRTFSLQLPVADLLECVQIFLRSARNAWDDELIFEKDEYIMITPESRYNFAEEMYKVAKGYLSDDLMHLKSLLGGARKPEGKDYARMSMVFMAIADKTVHDENRLAFIISFK